MAALSIGHFFTSKNRSIEELNKTNRKNPRIVITLSCQIRESVDELSSLKIKKEEDKKSMLLVSRIFIGVEKLGKGLKDSLSPKQKGDWKDLMLMSLSFAVYVYISQKIVCAYCVWMHMHMLNQPW